MKKMQKVLLSFFVLVTLLAGCASNTDNEKETAKKESDEVVIYLTRHGKTMLNTIDRSQGWIDAPLTPAGVEVAEFLGKGLKEEGIEFDEVHSSDSGRAIETAEVILKNNGQEDLISSLSKHQGLREYNFGTFEGMMNEEMQSELAKAIGQTPEEWMAKMQELGWYEGIKMFADNISKVDKERVEEGVNWPAEDYQTIADRSVGSIKEIAENAQKNGSKNVLVVSHGMTITTIVAELDNGKEADIPFGGPKNASIQKITYKDGKYTVETVNDLTLIEKGQAAK
ncbi:putative phosphoglycerate mutase [Breznakia blatticola]|uniref:phosphoglycerate mutase (2,3-diphosphoglycerate-dependent) n=1 Tax=Breznakia blatticola TaxID=1754012 RepID=A0A4R8A7J3_9FIRM|nr:histidine phosphatase family protein [Breznakia blatticola]TDW25818.1 putative phosphoglycerate mutase [Breznakia blatticola]